MTSEVEGAMQMVIRTLHTHQQWQQRFVRLLRDTFTHISQREAEEVK